MNKILLLTLLISTLGLCAQQNKNDPNLLKKYVKALSKYQKQHDSLNNPASYYYERAGLRNEYFDRDGAIADYNKVLEIDPDNIKTLYNRGLAKLDLSQLKQAVADFDKVIDLDPKHKFAYNNRGMCKDYMLNFNGAIRDYSAAIELDSKFAEAYNNRGISKIKMGLNNDGCDDLQTALRLGDKRSERNIKKLCDKR